MIEVEKSATTTEQNVMITWLAATVTTFTAKKNRPLEERMKKFLKQVWLCATKRTDPAAVLDARIKAVTQLAAMFAGNQWADFRVRMQSPEDPLTSLVRTHLRSVRCGHLLIL